MKMEWMAWIGMAEIYAKWAVSCIVKIGRGLHCRLGFRK